MYSFVHQMGTRTKDNSSKQLFSKPASLLDKNRLSNSNFMPTNNENHHKEFSQPPLHATSPTQIQTKLKIGQTDDVYEQEADRVADQIMRMPEKENAGLAQSVHVGVREHIQRQSGEEEEEEEELLQAKQQSGHSASMTPQIQAQINASRNSGQPLPRYTRSFFEPRFGVDFSNTRIHTDSQAKDSARALNARAFTVGQDIYFNQGEFQPTADSGKRLLGHELTHVIQQQSLGKRIQRDGTHGGLTPDERYSHTIAHAGSNRRDWEGGYRAANFLGIRISRGIHRELDDRLDLAADHLRTLHPDTPDAEIANRIGLYSISGRRNPRNAVGGNSITNHAYGLAIDVNYRGNPFIGRSAEVDEILNRVSQLILGREFHIRQQQTGTAEEIRANYAEVSQALQRYFRFYLDSDWAGLWELVNGDELEAMPDPHNLEAYNVLRPQMDQIEADYNNDALRNDFATNDANNPRDPAAGFIDLSQQLLEAMVGHAGLTWGGQYRRGKDMMHFDWRSGTIRTRHRI